MKEYDRARAIYKHALDHIPRGQASSLYSRFVAFEKQHGDRGGIEDVVLSKRRFQYEVHCASMLLRTRQKRAMASICCMH